MIVVYTDGSCKSNGNLDAIGGYGLVEIDEDTNTVLYCKSKKTEMTTNNREELKAVLVSLLRYGKNETPMTVYSDSAYVVNTFNDWMFKWQQNGWLKSDGKQPENMDLISMYYSYYMSGYRINLQKVKGHNNIFGNELADKLATGEMSADEVMKQYGKKIIY